MYLLPRLQGNPDKLPNHVRLPLGRDHESLCTRIAYYIVFRFIATLDIQQQIAVTNNGAISVFRSTYFTGAAVDR